MRILVVGAIQGGTVPMGRSLHRAFRAIGEEAHWLDFSPRLDEFVDVRASGDAGRLQAFFLSVKTHLVETVLQARPELIVGMAQSPLSDPEMLAGFRNAGIRLGYWFVEDYRLFTYWKTIAPHFDVFFTIQKEPLFGELKKIGCTNPHYLPAAFDDLLPISDPNGFESMPVSFVGAPYPNRVHLLPRLNGHSLQIFGEGWDRHPNPAVATGNRRIDEQECRHIYARTLVNINLHSSAHSHGFADGDFVNPRTFDIAGLGGFQLADMRRLLPLHFDCASEIPAFTDWDDLKDAIGYFLAHGAERKAWADRARMRVLAEHTYRHRAHGIIQVMEQGI